MNKKTLYILLAIFLAISSIGIVEAQVTIGNGEAPADGALLQLKNKKSITDGSANADKGVGMPRVALEGLKKLEPCVATTADNIKTHTGLIVYNTEESAVLKKGMHVWNGELWQPLNGEGSLGVGPWYKVGTTKPAIDNDSDSYLNAKAVVGGVAPIGDAQLSVHGNTIIDGKTTIGYKDTPLSGALLDLRTQQDSNPTQGGVNSTKGFMLPRVALTTTDNLDPLVLGGGTTIEKASHKGLTVYHVGGNGIDAGQRIWDGSRWLQVITNMTPLKLPQTNMVEQSVNADFGIPFETDVTKGPIQIPTKANVILEGAGNYRIDCRFRANIQANPSNNSNGMSTSMQVRVNGVTKDTYTHSQIILGLGNAGWEISFTSYLESVPANAQITIWATAYTNTGTPQNITNFGLKVSNPSGDTPSRIIWQKLD